MPSELWEEAYKKRMEAYGVPLDKVYASVFDLLEEFYLPDAVEVQEDR